LGGDKPVAQDPVDALNFAELPGFRFSNRHQSKTTVLFP
jgi:hypothetical protein